jgi:hypothetical protein
MKYDPNWREEDYDMTLKYDPVNPSTVNNILTQYKNQPVLEYINQLYKLIDYQRQIISEQRKTIIAVKHKEAWKRYDKPAEDYDPTTRQYSNRPPKSGNESC